MSETKRLKTKDVKFTKDQFDSIKKDNNGVPFYKTAAGKAAGARV